MDKFEKVDILLVEDNASDAELAMRALRKGKLANGITWVKDGAEALEFIFRDGAYAGRPDQLPRLILLDLKLPKVDGIEVLRRIKSDERAKTIPVVVLTSFTVSIVVFTGCPFQRSILRTQMLRTGLP